ncbi:MAG: hypothetical protein K2H41_07970 [Acetatifactor sp.]|nr:hypothetical protein [Acetatifactor sp.]
MKQLKNEKAKVLSQAIAPIIENWSDAPLLKFYNSLMEEIYSNNIVTEAYMVQNMMVQIIGEEYDCEFQEVEETVVSYKKYFSFQSMAIVQCAFEQEQEYSEPANSIFAQLNEDLDSLYIEKHKNSVKEGHMVDFLLQSPLTDIGGILLDSLISPIGDLKQEVMQKYKSVLETQIKNLALMSSDDNLKENFHSYGDAYE